MITCLLLLTMATPSWSPFRSSEPDVESGNRSYRARKYVLAQKLYSRAAEKHPGVAEANYNLGNSLYAQRKFKAAANAYRKALGAGDRKLRTWIHNNLGSALLRTGDLDSATREYRAALRLDPRYERARYNLELALRLRWKAERQRKKQKKKDGRRKRRGGKKRKQRKKRSAKRKKRKGQRKKVRKKQARRKKGKTSPMSRRKAQRRKARRKKERKAGARKKRAARLAKRSKKKQKPGKKKMKKAHRKVLDALRATSKILPVHRFLLPKYKRAPRPAKDW